MFYIDKTAPVVKIKTGFVGLLVYKRRPKVFFFFRSFFLGDSASFFESILELCLFGFILVAKPLGGRREACWSNTNGNMEEIEGVVLLLTVYPPRSFGIR